MDDERRGGPNGGVEGVRKGDIEPYTALRWVSVLFKSAAVFLAVAVVAEVIAGVRLDGVSALPMLLGEIARTVVFAVVLWGAGDLVRLLMQIGNDIRIDRMMMMRLVHRTPPRPEAGEWEGDRGPRLPVNRRVGPDRGPGEAAAD